MKSAALRLVNRLISTFGVCLKRTSAPTRSFEGFFAHLKRLGIEFRYIVDVGVGYGTHAIYDAFPKANYLLVEPIEEFKTTIESLRLNAEVRYAAAGSFNGAATINVHGHPTGSSLLKQAEGGHMDGQQRPINVVRLDSVLKEIPRPALLKIDTQGNELEVIAGLGNRISEFDAMIVEVSFMEFREGAPLVADVVERMRAVGFVAYDLLEGHTRALDGALAQVDIVFVPKDSPLRQERVFFSERQAALYLKH